MATSGVIGGSTSHQYVAVEVRWWLNWANADTNVSSVHVELWARRTNTGYRTWGTFNGGVNIDGVNYGVSRQLTLGPGDGWVHVHSADRDVTHDAWGNRQVWIAGYGGISGTGWNSTNCGATVQLDQLWWWPAKATPSPVRASDARVDVGLSYGSESPRGPILSTQLWRRQIAPATDWVRILDTGGKPGSYTDTGVQADRIYQYRASTWNWRGMSGDTDSGWVHTTPAAPTSVSAAKAADLSITVSWSAQGAYTPESYKVYDNGELVATVGGSITSWRHATPATNVQHTYTVSAVQGSLESARVAAPAVQLLAPPLAPTGLAPNGGLVLVGEVALAWRHNPVDTTPQAAYQLQYRKVGATDWVTVTGTTGASHTLTLTAGSYEWQVQTKGAADAYGAWSAVATVQAITAPAVAITSPTPGVLETSRATLTWAWTQAEGVPQSRWEAVLLNAAGGQLERLTGTGATISATFATRLADLTGYSIRVTAWAGGISASSTVAVTTDFPEPVAPVLSAVWDTAAGMAVLSAGPGVGDGPQVAWIDVERSVDGGATWETVLNNAAPAATTVTDPECLSNGVTLYRATSWTDLPSSASTQVEMRADSDVVWLGAGPGFAELAALPYNPEPQITAGRERAAVTYEGRSLPVAYSGEHTTRVHSWSGVWLDPGVGMPGDGMPLEQMIAVAQHPHPVHLLRDPDGSRIYGVLDDVQITRPYPGARGYQLKLTQTERG